MPSVESASRSTSTELRQEVHTKQSRELLHTQLFSCAEFEESYDILMQRYAQKADVSSDVFPVAGVIDGPEAAEASGEQLDVGCAAASPTSIAVDDQAVSSVGELHPATTEAINSALNTGGTITPVPFCDLVENPSGASPSIVDVPVPAGLSQVHMLKFDPTFISDYLILAVDSFGVRVSLASGDELWRVFRRFPLTVLWFLLHHPIYPGPLVVSVLVLLADLLLTLHKKRSLFKGVFKKSCKRKLV